MALSIIGAGLGRTGTSSLKMALEQLGVGRCYHMSELFLNPPHVPLWIRAADGEDVWEEIFEGYGATVDYPGCSFWRELMDRYPSAKVLLSLRDPEKWFESTQATIFSPEICEFLAGSPLAEFFAKTAWAQFGDRIHDRDVMIDMFNRHNDEVRKTVPADRLLVYEASQGWGPLCAFLGVSEPDKPFPRVNTREEYGGMLNMVRSQDPAQFDLDRFKAMIEERLRARSGQA